MRAQQLQALDGPSGLALVDVAPPSGGDGVLVDVLALEHLTFPLHPALDFAEGAALVSNYQTAFHCLSVRGRVAKGDRVLVHGAAGVDVVLDVVGGPRVVDSLRSLAPGGRVVVAGFAGGDPIPEVKVNRLLFTNTMSWARRGARGSRSSRGRRGPLRSRSTG